MTDETAHTHRMRWTRSALLLAWGWGCTSPACLHFVIVVTDEELYARCAA